MVLENSGGLLMVGQQLVDESDDDGWLIAAGDDGQWMINH